MIVLLFKLNTFMKLRLLITILISTHILIAKQAICYRSGNFSNASIWEDKIGSRLDLTKVPIQMFSGVLRLRLIYSPFERILTPVKFILKIADKLIYKRL